jgi:hypothetical protein
VSLVYVTPHAYFLSMGKPDVRVLPSFYVEPPRALRRNSVQIDFASAARLGAGVVLGILATQSALSRMPICLDLVLVDEHGTKKVTRSRKPYDDDMEFLDPNRQRFAAFTMREQLTPTILAILRGGQ